MPLSKDRVDILVLDHLIQQCHEKAAHELSNEIPPNSLVKAGFVSKNVPDSMKSIHRLIKHSIYNGEIDEAILAIKLHFPSVLDTNNLLHFTLLRLSLIEIIRRHKTEYPALGPDDIEREFLNKVLSFVHINLISKVARSPALFSELEFTMSLLCFRFDPQVSDMMDQPDFPAELKALFSYSMRYQCYALVNNAILKWFSQRNYTTENENNVGSATAVRWSSYDGQSNEYSGPSYGVGFGAQNHSLDTSANESQAVQGPGTFKYKVSVPRMHVATESLDRLKVSRTSTERLFGTLDLDLGPDNENAHLCETKLETLLRLWTLTSRLVDKTRRTDQTPNATASTTSTESR